MSLQRLSHLLFILAMCILLMYYARFILIPLSFGILIAILLHPLISGLRKLLKNHFVSFFIVIIAFVAMIILPLVLIFNKVASILKDASEGDSLKELGNADRFEAVLDKSPLNNLINTNNWDGLMAKGIEFAQNLVGVFVADTTSAFINIGLALVFSYFLHAYWLSSKKLILYESDDDNRRKLKSLIQQIPNVLRSYVMGTFSVIVIISVLTSTLLYFVGLDYAILWGVLVGILTIIPYFGSAIGILIPLVYSFIQNQSAEQLIVIMAGYFIIQQLEGNVITPKIVGNQVGINPFAIILIMLIMGQLWGIAGVLIAIPAAAILNILFVTYDLDFISKLIFQSKP